MWMSPVRRGWGVSAEVGRMKGADVRRRRRSYRLVSVFRLVRRLERESCLFLCPEAFRPAWYLME